MSPKSLRLAAVLLPASLLIHAACGTTYTSTSGATGAQMLPDGAIVWSNDAGGMPSNNGGSAAPEAVPFAALGPGGSCFVGASGLPRCEGFLFASYDVGADEFGTPITSSHQLELKTLVFPPKVRKVWLSNGNICVLGGYPDVGLHCAGNNDSRQIGVEPTDDATPFLPLHIMAGFDAGVTDAMLGTDYGCALKGGTTSCWGVGITKPGAVALPAPAVQLAGGSQSRCALTAAGDVYCWGYNVVPRAKPADTSSSSVEPLLIATGGKVASISMSPLGSHICALRTTGVVLCWGRNPMGQVGQAATTALVDTPSTVDTVSPSALAAAAGAEHSCAMKENGGVFCWGNAERGALGDNVTRAGASNSVPTPGAVDQLASGASALFVGYGSSCALVGTGESRSFKCWGANTLGKLQNGNTQDQKAPVIVTLPN